MSLFRQKKTHLEKTVEELTAFPVDRAAEADVGTWVRIVDLLASDSPPPPDAKAALPEIMDRRKWTADDLAYDVKTMKLRRLLFDPDSEATEKKLAAAATAAKEAAEKAKADAVAAHAEWIRVSALWIEHGQQQGRARRLISAHPRIFGSVADAINRATVERARTNYAE